MTNNVKESKAAAEAAAAQAELDRIAADAAVVDNRTAMKAALIEKAEAYGVEAATGDMSQTKVAFLFNQAVRERLMTEADAGAVYTAYAKGYNAARIAKGSLVIADTTHFVHGDGMNDVDRGKGAEKTAISIFRTFGRPAVVAQGLEMYQDVRELRELLGADDRAQGSLFNAFVAVNRAVTKAADESERPDVEFRYDEALILATITKAGGGKTDVEKLAALCAALGKLIKTGKFDDSIEDAARILSAVKPKAVGPVAVDTSIVTREHVGSLSSITMVAA